MLDHVSMEDITYNIVPDADFKFYITANIKTRALNIKN